ncbi:hypothetical protein Acor_05250 [Acrocarpospora corrugata]|uniref:Uncharacterized protein n=1 Tax=Acrocarpospora corrugata TaxID=35763 RepID=A0A5M3VPR4_9ACTN|nr:hypothetical protein [Acrocarpospora corrugata]GER98463.1 hypothetical protein Acor_05250 [Acrocarpospora corrugata]
MCALTQELAAAQNETTDSSQNESTDSSRWSAPAQVSISAAPVTETTARFRTSAYVVAEADPR